VFMVPPCLPFVASPLLCQTGGSKPQAQGLSSNRTWQTALRQGSNRGIQKARNPQQAMKLVTQRLHVVRAVACLAGTRSRLRTRIPLTEMTGPIRPSENTTSLHETWDYVSSRATRRFPISTAWLAVPQMGLRVPFPGPPGFRNVRKLKRREQTTYLDS
jgi:hypothetical protein